MARADEPAFVPPCEPFWADPPPHGGGAAGCAAISTGPGGRDALRPGRAQTRRSSPSSRAGCSCTMSWRTGAARSSTFCCQAMCAARSPLARAGAAHTAEALTEAAVAVLPRSGLPAMLAGSPGYGEALMTRMAASVQGAQDALVDAGRRSALEAVAHLLLRLDARARAATGERDRTAIGFPADAGAYRRRAGVDRGPCLPHPSACCASAGSRRCRASGCGSTTGCVWRRSAGVEPACRVDTARAGESADPASLGEAG